jgi:hypothetical protein
MRRVYIIISVIWCLVSFLACQSEVREVKEDKNLLLQVEAKTEVDKTTATTGDLIRYTLSAHSDPQIEVEIPEMGSQIAGFRIVDMGESDPAERDGRKITEKWYQLKADLVGSYIIPGAVFSFRDEKGEKKEVKTAQIFIEVKSVIEDGEEAGDIRDIKPLASIERSYTMLLSLSIAGVVLLALITGGIYFYRAKYQKTKAIPSRPAHELALEELDLLQKKELIAKGIYKEHYFSLSEIFRKYLERRFHFQAVEKTTEELLPEILDLKEFDQEIKDTAKKFLQHTDLVKFAKHTPDMQEVDQEHQEAVDFIKETKEKPVQNPR